MVSELEQNEQIEPSADNDEAVVDLAALAAEADAAQAPDGAEAADDDLQSSATFNTRDI